ncbi:VWA domain-containing protein [Candidatus Woesearchaeota archaeon]|nr:VWA domain-containing protein [Candidatus Woesearchaeota archaeon]
MAFDLEVEVKQLTKAEEAEGKLKTSLDEALMHSVLEGDKKTIDEGAVIEEALNRNIHSFTPDLSFEQLVNNFQMAKKILGPKIIRYLTGFDESYVEKNVRIPEFQKEMKKNMDAAVEQMRRKKIIDDFGQFTDQGIQLAALVMYTRELERVLPRGMFGEKLLKESSQYGDRHETRPTKKGDSYRDLAVRESVRMAVRRSHKSLHKEDLRTHTRHKLGTIYIVYAVDASASMKGKKIAVAKRAGMALAFKALSQQDKVGLIVFSKDVHTAVAPTSDFSVLLQRIIRVRASKQTDFAVMLERAARLFPLEGVTKHLIVLTDALPTAGDAPETETLRAISLAKDAGITVSIVGIGLDKKAMSFAKRCTELGDGRLSLVRNLEQVDRIVLEDYESLLS